MYKRDGAGHGMSRRGVLTGAAALGGLTLAGCGNGVGSNGAAVVDQRVDATQNFLFETYPGTEDVARKASGALYMPVVTKAGFGVGGSYGTGALRINDVTVDYYQALQASFGFQVGAQPYAHVLYFMSEEALRRFRTSAGWAIGADAEYAVIDQGGNLSADTITTTDPVVAFVFGQAGLLVGASLEGTKYNRIIP